MTMLEKVEKEIQSLNAKDLARFREWFAKFDAANWDTQIEADSASGRLDEIGKTALAAHRAKQTRRL